MRFLMIWGLDSSVELALANLDLNEPVLEPFNFADGDPVEGSFSTPTYALIGLDIDEEEKGEDGGESHGSDADFDDSNMEKDY